MKHIKMYAVVLTNKEGFYEYVGHYLFSKKENAEEVAREMSEDMGEKYHTREFEITI